MVWLYSGPPSILMRGVRGGIEVADVYAGMVVLGGATGDLGAELVGGGVGAWITEGWFGDWW